jgi:hypothetical protein
MDGIISTMRRVFPFVAAVLAIAGAGCGKLDAPAAEPFQVMIRVTGDVGRPLAGATILRDTKELGTTQIDGGALVALNGNEGDSVDLSIRCPQNFQSPLKPVTVVLVRFVEQKVPEYQATCTPFERRVVVAVRANNGANLPVRYLGNVLGRTDASGVAHFELPVRPGEQFDLTLDTTERGNERLKPQNPSKSFVVRPQEEVMLFQQDFDIEKKAVYIARPKIPQRL